MQKTGYMLVTICLAAITLNSCKKERSNIMPPNDSTGIIEPQKRTEIFITTADADTARHLNYLIILDKNGDTLKIKSESQKVSDFRKWEYEGKTRYSYFLQDPNFFMIPGSGYTAGYRVITDTSFNKIKRVKLVSHGAIDATQQPGLENHDFLLLSDNHYIAQAYYEIAPRNIPAALNPATGIKVLTPVVQEVLNGQVVWQWVGSDYPQLYENSIQFNDFSIAGKPNDYLHINSLYIDPKDGNLIISLRHCNQILKLDRKNSSIIWKLGGKNSDFNIPEGMQFLRQHFATYINQGKTLMLLDNGEANERSYSRVLEFDMDETSRTITAARAFDIPAPFIQFAGSVQKFGTRYFIGGGSEPFILEVDIDKKIKTFEMQLPDRTNSYRALKYE